MYLFCFSSIGSSIHTLSDFVDFLQGCVVIFLLPSGCLASSSSVLSYHYIPFSELCIFSTSYLQFPFFFVIKKLCFHAFEDVCTYVHNLSTVSRHSGAEKVPRQKMLWTHGRLWNSDSLHANYWPPQDSRRLTFVVSSLVKFYNGPFNSIYSAATCLS